MKVPWRAFAPLLLLVSCSGAVEPAVPATAPVATTAESAVAQKNGPVVRLVFADQEKPCACAKTRIDKGWAAVQAVLATDPALSVERIHMDTEWAKYAPYNDIKPSIAAPALYFLDAQGRLVQFVQGDFVEAHVRAGINGLPPSEVRF